MQISFAMKKGSAVIKKRVFLRLDDGNGSKRMRTFIVIDVIRFAVFLTAR